jgi:hypothetical protein
MRIPGRMPGVSSVRPRKTIEPPNRRALSTIVSVTKAVHTAANAIAMIPGMLDRILSGGECGVRFGACTGGTLPVNSASG